MVFTSESRMTCPPQQIWDELVAGLIRGEQARLLAEHASLCADCAALLRASIEVFGPENQTLTVASRGLFGRRRPASAEDPRGSAKIFAWRIAMAAAALIGVLGTPYLYRRHTQPVNPLTHLAAAYTTHRTLELRIPGAGHAIMRLEGLVAPGSLPDEP